MTAQSPISARTEVRQFDRNGFAWIVVGRIVFSIVGGWRAGVPLEFMAGIFIIGSECAHGPRDIRRHRPRTPGPAPQARMPSPSSGPSEEKNPKTYANCGQPTATVDIFMQEESGGQSVGDKGECGGRRAHNAEVCP